MAGTGHDYEILNPEDLDATVESLADRVATEASRGWLRSRHFRRFLSGPAFVHVPFEDDAARRIEAYRDPSVRTLLAAKAAAGLVRTFAPGPAVGTLDDPDHVADYLAAVEDHPLHARRIAHASVSSVALKARAWTHAAWKARCSASAETQTSPLLPSVGGRRWVVLEGPDALAEEGRRMSHCVGGQSAMLGSGGSVFYSLRGPSGRPLLTVREDPGPDGRLLGDARGFANATDLPWYADDIVLLARHVHMVPTPRSIGSMSGFGVEWDGGNGWRTTRDALEPFPVDGASALHDTRRVVLVGGDGGIVAVMTGPEGWMHRREFATVPVRISVRTSGVGRDGPALAALVTRFDGAKLLDVPDFLVRLADGTWTDWRSSHERSSIGAFDVRTRNGVAEIHADEAGPLALVRTTPRGGAVAEFLRSDISERTVSGLAEVLNVLGCSPCRDRTRSDEEAAKTRRSLEKAGLEFLHGPSRWIHRPDETTVLGSPRNSPVRVEGTSWDMTAKGPDAEMSSYFDADGRVARIRLGLLSQGDFSREAKASAAALSRCGRVPSPDLAYEGSMAEYRIAEGGAVFVPVWNGSSWRSLRVSIRSKELIDHLAGRPAGGTAGLAALVVRAFSRRPLRGNRRRPDRRTTSLAALRLLEHDRFGIIGFDADPQADAAAEGFGLLGDQEAATCAKRVAQVLERKARRKGRLAWLDFRMDAPLAGTIAARLPPARSARLLRAMSGSPSGRNPHLPGLDLDRPRAMEAVRWLAATASHRADPVAAALAVRSLAETLCSEPDGADLRAFAVLAGPVLGRSGIPSYRRERALGILRACAAADGRDGDPGAEAIASLVSALERQEAYDANRYSAATAIPAGTG